MGVALQVWGVAHLTRALGAVVHSPLVSVFANNAVMDTNTSVDADPGFDQLVLVCLEGIKQ